MLAQLSKSAEKTFRRLMEELSAVGHSRIIDNTNKTFMPVHVEIVGTQGKSLLVSVDHYFEQNGDLCQDPEMVFLVNDLGVFPMTFQQAIPPVYQEAVRFEGERMHYFPRMQRDLTKFANDWMKNIRHQQF